MSAEGEFQVMVARALMLIDSRDLAEQTFDR